MFEVVGCVSLSWVVCELGCQTMSGLRLRAERERSGQWGCCRTGFSKGWVVVHLNFVGAGVGNNLAIIHAVGRRCWSYI